MLMYKIRKAEEKDIPVILEEAKKFISTLDTKFDLYNENNLLIIVQGLIKSHIFIVCEKEGTVIGGIGGPISPNLWNPIILELTELFWWVSPEHRKSRAGALLLETFTLIGSKFVKRIILHTMNISKVNDKTLLKRGYKYKEQSFVKEL